MISIFRTIPIVIVSLACAADGAEPLVIPSDVQAVMNTYCASCHGADKQKGKVRLDTLLTLTGDARTDLLDAMHESIRFEEMPPEDEKQPTAAERKLLDDWIGRALVPAGPSKLADKLRRPDYGNHVDHDKLFSGQYADLKGYTHDRRWLISEYIFDAKMNRIIKHNPYLTIDGKRHHVVGSNNRRVILTNPFLLPTNSGVRYYANESLNGGHFLTMIANAKNTAAYMNSHLAKRDKRYLPAVTAIMAMEDEHNATLARREQFLSRFIERVLVEMYADEHEALLPKFVPVEINPVEVAADGETIKKSPFHAAQLGNVETEIMYRSMRRLKADGDTDAQWIARCEREWFYHGHNPRKIEMRLTFLQNYLPEWRNQIAQHNYDQRTRRWEYRPLADAEMAIVHQTIRKHRKKGDRFNAVIAKCMAEWEQEFEQQRIAAGPPDAKTAVELVEQLFGQVLEREPTEAETKKYVALAASYFESLGNTKAIERLIQTLMLRSEFVYRSEFGTGEADGYDRRMMSPRDASYAIAYALTDSSPDAELARAAAEGRLNTREDYEREVRRLLSQRDRYYMVDESVGGKGNDLANFTNMPIRELRFFREFFGYPKMLSIFKDRKRFGGDYELSKRRFVAEADRLVEHLLEKDRDVFETLLTTDKFYVYHSGDNEAMKASTQRIQKIYDYFKDKGWEEFELEDLAEHRDFIAEIKMRGIDAKRMEKDRRYNPLNAFMKQMTSFEVRLGKGQTAAVPHNSFPAHGMANANSRLGGRLQGPEVAKAFNIDLADWDYPSTQPAKMEHRKGILTHPAWLIAFAQNTETDPIHRGKWVQEKLLAGTIPDVPITVDAVIPEDPHKTMRQRMQDKTGQEYCWKCHKKMDPLGLPFEIYDDFGRYRTQERLEYPENLIRKGPDKAEPHVDLRDIYKTLPVDPRGVLRGTGDDSLDGEVADALDLIDRLARSQRVRQSIIRHAFRYFLGRNETLSDSKTLIDADRAYVDSGGSFDAVVVSLLTSDSFIYRKPVEN